MHQDIYSRVQKLVNEIEGMVKSAQETSETEEELKEYETVSQVEVEPSEFSEAMDQVLRKAYPSSVAATPEREDEGGESEDVQEDSDANTELSVAEGDTSDIETEEPIITGEDVEEALKEARRKYAKLSDFELLRVLRKEARMLCEIATRLEKAASFNVAYPPRTEQDVIANILKRANEDADLLAEYLASQGVAPEEASAEEGVAEGEAPITPEEEEEAVAELEQEAAEADAELADEIMEAAAELAQELEAGVPPETAVAAAPIETILQEYLAAGGTPEEIEEAIDELVDEIDEAVAELQQEQEQAVKEMETAEMDTQGEQEESVEEPPTEESAEGGESAEESVPLSDEDVVQEVGNAMEDLGITPEELVAETENKDEEKKEAARKIASAVRALKRSGRFRRREASKQADRRLRESVKSYLLELIS